jgi:hypothetical protein
MLEAVITANNHLALPQLVCDSLGLHNGVRVQFIPMQQGFQILAEPAATKPKQGLESLKGAFKNHDPDVLSIQEMNRIISEMGSRSEAPWEQQE